MFVRNVDPELVDWESETDFIIVGGGGCGLSAAATAAAHCDVTLLEKADRVGGKARVATGQICGVGSSLQHELGIDDSAEAFYEDLLVQQTETSAERYTLNHDLVTTVAGRSGETLDWLMSEVGAGLTLHTGRFEMAGHRVHRTHYPVRADGVIPRAGQPVTDALHETALDRDVDIRTEFPCDQLVLDEETGQIIGVASKENPSAVPRRQSTIMIRAEHVLLACDGFAANPELVAERLPEIADLDYWGTRENTGDALRIAEELGLRLDEPLYDMHGPFTVPEGVYLPNELVKAGSIIVNEDAERFMDCGNVPYRMMDMHILDQESSTGYLVLDESIVDLFIDEPLTTHQFSFLLDEDCFDVSDSVAAVADRYGLDANDLARTIESVNRAARDDDAEVPYGRAYPHNLAPPFYTAKIRPMYVKARQGIVVDERMRVVREDGSVIENLYAGGNASESLEAGDPNVYIPGMDLMTALTEGHLVGEFVGKSVAGAAGEDTEGRA
ncbi:FAD-dependent oxidoreductase [Halomarina ordinaria]|uniref:FAD-dependent oxidoreductase n=1 Tax=Halomarina ordinaria TaxID=3033939 RepID=A0ABD5UBF7_9EURY|nr:FAD-dependent oxidoreductase [Halomarina sp. PSRA2]